MTATKLTGPELLRADAEGRLRTGTAPASGGWSVGADTLSLLYRLASDPESSADALKLLHELQTHQVELDLQHAQLSENESDLLLQLGHFQALYEHAPAGYLVLGLDGRIVHANLAAKAFFGLDEEELKEHMLVNLLSPNSRPAVQAALDRAVSSGKAETLALQTPNSRSLVMVSRMAPGRDAILVLIFDQNRTLES